MKAKRLKISVITTIVIFLCAGASWADGAKNRHHNRIRNEHIRTEHDRGHGYRQPSHNHREWNEHLRGRYQKHYDCHIAAHRAERHAFYHRQRYHRAVHQHDHHRHKGIRKHYHKHRPSYNVFSYRGSIFEPGWSVTIKTKSRW